MSKGHIARPEELQNQGEGVRGGGGGRPDLALSLPVPPLHLGHSHLGRGGKS